MSRSDASQMLLLVPERPQEDRLTYKAETSAGHEARLPNTDMAGSKKEALPPPQIMIDNEYQMMSGGMGPSKSYS